MTAPRRIGRPYRRLRAWIIANRTTCCRCGRPVDKTLPGEHEWGPTLDHLQPISRGGALLDPNNVDIAHRRCNLSYGNGTKRQHYRQTTTTPKQPSSRSTSGARAGPGGGRAGGEHQASTLTNQSETW